MTTQNEAAERLRDFVKHDGCDGHAKELDLIEEALAESYVKGVADGQVIESAERRATVERIRERYEAEYAMGRGGVGRKKVHAILDEELRTADAKAAR